MRRLNNQTFKKILVVAAHPDDEVLGCGATIAKLIDSGHTVQVLILGEGITSRKHLSPKEKEKSLKILRDVYAKRANAILGVEHLILHTFPTAKFDNIPLLSVVHKIEEIMDEFRPNIIYTHNHSDVNIDHRRTLEAVEAAVRPLPSQKLEQIFAFETPSSTEWNFTRPPFCPNVFNEVSPKHLNKKIRALKEYKSETRPFPHPRSPEYLTALAMVRGGQSGMKLAEAFRLVYERRLGKRI